MKNSDEKNESLENDCSLILEAIHRLKDGTWNLCDEDSDWANHLLPKVKEALIEHIEFESSCVLPVLSQEVAELHAAEHLKILALLNDLESRLTGSDADHFQASLILLIETLELHHNQFGYLAPTDDCKNECAKESIKYRAHKPSLEY